MNSETISICVIVKGERPAVHQLGEYEVEFLFSSLFFHAPPPPQHTLLSFLTDLTDHAFAIYVYLTGETAHHLSNNQLSTRPSEQRAMPKWIGERLLG